MPLWNAITFVIHGYRRLFSVVYLELSSFLSNFRSVHVYIVHATTFAIVFTGLQWHQIFTIVPLARMFMRNHHVLSHFVASYVSIFVSALSSVVFPCRQFKRNRVCSIYISLILVPLENASKLI